MIAQNVLQSHLALPDLHIDVVTMNAENTLKTVQAFHNVLLISQFYVLTVFAKKHLTIVRKNLTLHAHKLDAKMDRVFQVLLYVLLMSRAQSNK